MVVRFATLCRIASEKCWEGGVREGGNRSMCVGLRVGLRREGRGEGAEEWEQWVWAENGSLDVR